MTERHDFTDEELTAFIDGELDAQRSALLEKSMKSNQSLSVRVTQLQSATAGLSEAFDGLLAAAPMAPEVLSPSSSRPAWQVPMGLAAALVMGLLLGTQLVQTSAPTKDWMGYVAAYQRLYVTETLTNVALSEDEKTVQLAKLGEKLGTNLGAVADARQLDFTRGQVLGYEDRAIIQLAFLSPDGAPVALCIVESANPSELEVEITEMEGLKAAVWASSSHSYLLIGGTDAGLIERAAQQFRSAL